jgi:hypothetical protein
VQALSNRHPKPLARRLTDAFPYVWTWRRRTWRFPGVQATGPWFGDGVDRVGQRCRVVVRGSMNTALLEFEDGYRVVTSRAGLRRGKPDPDPTANATPPRAAATPHSRSVVR